MTFNTQFYTNLLTEFLKPAGPLAEKSQIINQDPKPLLNGFISKGFNINYTDNVEIELNGLNIKTGRNIFRQDCFEFNCFEEEGIITYAKNVSDICLVDSNNFLTAKQRLTQNKQCYIDTNNNTTFFVRGTPDLSDNVYLADIGIVNTTSGVFSAIDKNVPFYFNNKSNSLSALSTSNIPKGVKCAYIKKVNRTSITNIGIVYGELNNQFYFPHNNIKSNKTFTYKDQSINLENLAINLTLLSSFKQFENKPNQIIYRDFNYSSPEIEEIINKSSQNLVSLILTEIGLQEGSIPNNIASYSSSENEYNSIADLEYINRVKSCFENNCFDTGCFERIYNNSLLNRSIDNRAIAWTIQYLTSYSINYSIDLSENIISLVEYLLNQKDKSTKLFYKGWDQKEQESICDEITLENLQVLELETEEVICSELEESIDETIFQYNNSLVLNKEIISSTNIAIFLALLKTFETTQNFNYLIEADNLYQSINRYLITNEGLLKHSLNIYSTSLESATYNLILYLILEDYKNINPLIDFFNIRLNAIPELQDIEIFVNNNNIIVGSQQVVISPNLLLNSDDDLNLFSPTINDNINNTEEISKYNYLIVSSLNLLNSKIYIPFISAIKSKLELINLKIENSREDASLVFAIGALINNNSFIDIDTIKFNSLFEFNSYQFQKSLTLNNLLLNTPKDYGWFSINKLNRDSNIGNMYYAIAQVLAKNVVEYETIKNNVSIDNMYGIVLNKKAKEYNLKRFVKEPDSLFRNRIKTEIYTRGVSKPIIENRAAQFNSPTTIKDNYISLLTYESNSNNDQSINWGEGYLQGINNFNTNISTFNFNQPVEEDVYKEIYKFKPLGSVIKIRENLTFSVGNTSTLLNIVDSTPSCTNLLLQQGGNYLNENNTIFCLEDEIVVINCEHIATEQNDTILITEDNIIICSEDI